MREKEVRRCGQIRMVVDMCGKRKSGAVGKSEWWLTCAGKGVKKMRENHQMSLWVQPITIRRESHAEFDHGIKDEHGGKSQCQAKPSSTGHNDSPHIRSHCCLGLHQDLGFRASHCCLGQHQGLGFGTGLCCLSLRQHQFSI